jgi:hypothetical protein
LDRAYQGYAHDEDPESPARGSDQAPNPEDFDPDAVDDADDPFDDDDESNDDDEPDDEEEELDDTDETPGTEHE